MTCQCCRPDPARRCARGPQHGLFSLQVVGWPIGLRLTKKLVADPMRMAWLWRRPAAGLMRIRTEEISIAAKSFMMP